MVVSEKREASDSVSGGTKCIFGIIMESRRL